MSQNKSKRYQQKRNQQIKPWLPVIVALAGIVLIALAVLGLRDKTSGKAEIEFTGSPRLKVDQEKVDLGDVKMNTPVEVSFQLTNVGDQTLRFTEEPYIEVVEGC
jgi:hypothetical protein